MVDLPCCVRSGSVAREGVPLFPKQEDEWRETIAHFDQNGTEIDLTYWKQQQSSDNIVGTVIASVVTAFYIVPYLTRDNYNLAISPKINIARIKVIYRP